MCKRKRHGLCLPATYYLAGETRHGHKSHYKAMCIGGAIYLLEVGQLVAV